MNVDELCMGCMSQRGGTDTCSHCGYVEGTPTASLLHLPPRTLLHGQYVIGRVLGHGGFGITYIGWDKLLERKLAVKEYFPAGIAMRSGEPKAGSSGSSVKVVCANAPPACAVSTS